MSKKPLFIFLFLLSGISLNGNIQEDAKTEDSNQYNESFDGSDKEEKIKKEENCPKYRTRIYAANVKGDHNALLKAAEAEDIEEAINEAIDNNDMPGTRGLKKLRDFSNVENNKGKLLKWVGIGFACVGTAIVGFLLGYTYSPRLSPEMIKQITDATGQTATQLIQEAAKQKIEESDG